MSERIEPRWLNPEATAAYIGVRIDALPRLVKQGRIPRPNYRLGERSPRWDRLALDADFDGGTASTNIREAVQSGVEKIIRAGRQKNTRRRDGENVSVSVISRQA